MSYSSLPNKFPLINSFKFLEEDESGRFPEKVFDGLNWFARRINDFYFKFQKLCRFTSGNVEAFGLNKFLTMN